MHDREMATASQAETPVAAFVGVEEAARILGVTIETVRRALVAGRLPGKQLAPRGHWRIPLAALHAWGTK